ncbi:MAG: copper homeostasis protein CutC [Crocinitomicaceae bacterium]
MYFEVCIDSVEGAIAAEKFGAKRVELCAALSEGGLSPSAGMIEACAKVLKNTQLFVMIRPRGGDFTYSESEILVMERDIVAAKQLGADGVVFGILEESGDIDIQKNMALIEKAFENKLGTTFHRAIDVSLNPIAAIEHLVHIGFDRILTSGGEAKALQGIGILNKMKEIAQNQIEIMAGSGVDVEQIEKFKAIGMDAVHFTAKTNLKNTLSLDMGPQTTVDTSKIEAIANQLNN